MKPFLLSFLVFISIAVNGQIIQDPATNQVTPVISQPKSIRETVGTDSISVTYGRPYKTGHIIFGSLRKFGKVWEAGANKATTITFSRNVNFAGEEVAAGTYTLFVIPYESQWTIILNTQLEQWGTSTYEKYKDWNVVSVNVPVTQLVNEIEQLTIRFVQSIAMIIEWDNVQVTIPII